MIRTGIRPALAGLAALALALFVMSLGATSAEAGKTKSIRTEARFVEFNDKDNTITVKVKKTGKKAKNAKLRLKNGKEATFKVKPEGSVLLRTSVTLNGKRAAITDIPVKKLINIYWVPDEADENVRFARKIDMILSDAEAEARDNARLEAAKAAGTAAE